MSTDMLEELDTITTTSDGDHDRFAHYFPKKALDAAMFERKVPTAMCGKKVPRPFNGIDGRTICPTCNELYEGLAE